jgi:predicted nucleotidyltransferase
VNGFDPIRILRALADHDVEFVVIGQAAAVIHGHPETTVDVDVVPRQDVDNAERLAQALRSLHGRLVTGSGDDALVLEPDERDFVGQPGVVMCHTDAGPVDVISFAAGLGGFEDLARSAVPVDLGGFTVLVASLDDVIASKEAAGRPKDLRRLPSLRAFRQRKGG